MNHDDSLDKLLKKALSSTQIPDEELNEIVKNRMKEKMVLKKTRTKPTLRLAFITAALIVTMSVTVFAVVKYLSADEFADSLAYPALAEAFKSEDAIQINESQTSGGYKISLLGIVSGEKLTQDDINKESTYAVVAIEKLDGTMPTTRDEEYGETPFFVSPLIKGLKPWQVNICTMSGGYTETVVDGVMYRLIECDSVEMFADRGVYLCVSSTTFYNINAFAYNNDTGEITPNPDYDGVNVLFDLPIDKSKADPEKAEQFLKGQELLNASDSEEEEDTPAEDSDITKEPELVEIIKK